MSLLTTTQLAHALGVADSTVRHYRAAGRIVPQATTPGGHARYDLRQVSETLGIDHAPEIKKEAPTITGLFDESFPPLGVHRVSSADRPVRLPAEMVALGVRENDKPRPARGRWGGELVNPRRKAHT